MRIINRHNISKHFRRAGSQQAFGANVVLDSAGNTGQRRDSVTGGDFRIDFGRLRQSVFFIQRHIGSDLVLNSVDALIQGFGQFHGADFFINEFIMQFMSSALVKIHSSSSLSYSITRGTLKPPLWTAGAFFSASSCVTPGKATSSRNALLIGRTTESARCLRYQAFAGYRHN